MKTLSLLGLLAAQLSVAPAAHAQASCGCNDVRDMRNRICEAKAAIGEYQRHIYRIKQREEKDGKPIMFTPELYRTQMQPCVQEVLNSVTDGGAKKATGETDSACEISVKAPNQCLRESIEAHERQHQRTCKARTDDTNQSFLEALRGTFKDFRESMTLVDVALDEMWGYQSEINSLRSRLVELVDMCPQAMFEIERPGGRRQFSLDGCAPPRPRPAPEQSACLVR